MSHSFVFEAEEVPNDKEIVPSVKMQAGSVVLGAVVLCGSATSTLGAISTYDDNIRATYTKQTYSTVGSIVDVTFKGFSQYGTKNVYTVTTTPTPLGTLYEPASNYCRYGSTAITKIGDEATDAITSVPADVSCYNTKTASHFLFKVDSNEVLPTDGPVAVVTYYITSEDVTDSTGVSKLGKHYFVSSDNILVASNFDISTDGWTYSDNGKKSPDLTYDASRITSSSGVSLSKFVFLADEFQNPDADGVDQDLWHFVAPSKFYGDMAMAYKGQLCFTMGKASGDFSNIQAGGGDNLHVVELECSTCVDRDGKQGTRMALPYSKLSTPFTGTTVTQCITLDESAGWLLDPENSNYDWLTPTNCEVVTLLHRLSSLKILGDYTPGKETVLLDDVKVTAGASNSIPSACYAEMQPFAYRR